MKSKSKINNIQVLRAFAAVSVATFHTGYRFPHLQHFGYFGVSVFFVISGYIMAMISTTKPEHFLLRRVIRIVPPYWAMTVLLFFFAHWYPDLVKSHTGFLELLKSLFFIPFMKGNGLVMPLLFLGWTLNYEMFFYAILALALRISARRAPAVAALLILLTLFVCGFLTDLSVVWRFYSDTVMLDFVLGMAAFYICREFPDGVGSRARSLLAITLVAAAGTLILIEGRSFLGVQPFWILLGLPSFVLVTSAVLLSQSGWDVQTGWVILLGDASYVLYLIHPYLEYLISRVLATRMHWLAPDTLPGFLVAISTAILVSLLLHVKVELPVVNYLNRKLVHRTVPGPVAV